MSTLKEIRIEIEKCKDRLAEIQLDKLDILEGKATIHAKTQVWLLSKKELELEAELHNLIVRWEERASDTFLT
jgi:hypothetical protein